MYEILIKLRECLDNPRLVKADEIYEDMVDCLDSKESVILLVEDSQDDSEFAWAGSWTPQELVGKVESLMPVNYLDYAGGIIVTSYKDINFSICFEDLTDQDPPEVNTFMLNLMSSVLNKYFDADTFIDNNDILDSSGKISGSVCIHLGTVFEISFSISLTDHSESIDEIGFSHSDIKKPTYVDIDKEKFYKKFSEEIDLLIQEYEENK